MRNVCFDFLYGSYLKSTSIPQKNQQHIIYVLSSGESWSGSQF